MAATARLCAHTGCRTQPCYGAPGTHERIRCAAHRRADDVDNSHRLCRHRAGEPGACTKKASFGPPDARTRAAAWCAAHRGAGDVDIAHKRCAHPGCAKQPSYCADGAGPPRWCAAHRAADAVCARYLRCRHGRGADGPECLRRARYGVGGGAGARWCAAHRRPGDVDVQHPRCLYRGGGDGPACRAAVRRGLAFCDAHCAAAAAGRA